MADGAGFEIEYKHLTIKHLQALTSYPQEPGTCPRFDVDGDGDVDQSDFAAFQRCLRGALPLDLSCVE